MASVDWVEGNSSGPHRAPVTKLVLHTTEGSSIEGALAAYRTNNSWPHSTVDPKKNRICRHLGYDVAARSLRNMPGGVETNTVGVIQIEVVGSATNPAGIDWEWVGREVVGPICREVGIPIQSSVHWVGYPASYGTNAPQRLTYNLWLAYMGVLGHEHVPENDHGDPGAIPIELLLDAAQPPATPKGRGTKVLDLASHNDGVRSDLVLVSKDHTTWHYYRLSPGDEWSPGENLGGFLKCVACEWVGEVFVVSGQGKNDMPWEKRWSAETGWTPWLQTPEDAPMLPPAENV